VVASLRLVEDRFNRWFNYPYVFLNNKEWESAFIERVNSTISGEARFEVLPERMWDFPEGVDAEAARKSMREQERQGVGYGGNEDYHHMCRFFSGDFPLLDALKDYRWYWRIEPDVKFFCDLTYDPFAEMARRGKTYGWTMALWEMPDTVPGLFRATADYREAAAIAPSALWKAMVTAELTPWPLRRLWSLMPLRDSSGDRWNQCHFWSNFEIADLDWFRSATYQSFYRHLLGKGGFYHERWGDAPVHSLAIAMLLDPRRVHHFEDIGYQHDDLWVCPSNAAGGQPPDSTDPRWVEASSWDAEREDGIGCRCSCPDGGKRRRNLQAYCTNKMKAPNTPRFG